MKAEKSGVGFILAFPLSEMENHWGLLSRGVTQSDLHLKRPFLPLGGSWVGRGARENSWEMTVPVQAADPASSRRFWDVLFTRICTVFLKCKWSI